MIDFNFKPLVDEIRACFPAITRDRVSISHGATAHNGNILALRVRVILDERFPTYDSDKLMSLLDADEMLSSNGEAKIAGKYEGNPCQIILVTRQPVA
jgi:hypothetical protein